MAAQVHRSDPRILGRRTLERDHRCLAEILHPGLGVLDVGCGTGAITAGIAKAVGPEGYAVGVDRDESLLQIGRTEYGTIPNLRFECGDVTALKFRLQFDIVSAARTLQWIADPGLAVLKMKEAAKSSGVIVVLDYNHATNRWEPEPPAAIQLFYNAFLEWRRANGWDNEMADHLPGLFEAAGLVGVRSHVQDEVVERGGPGFDEATAIWPGVITNVGEQIEKSGFCTRRQLEEARESFESWGQTALMKQTLAMRAVTGIVP